MQLTFDLPLLSADRRDTSKEMTEVKNYLYRLTEQLRYVLANLDGDNFSGSITDSIKAEINNTIASVRSSADRLSGELNGIKTRLVQLEKSSAVIKTGSAVTDANGDAEIFYEGFDGIPAVTVCCADDASGINGGIAVHSVTASGAKLRFYGAPEGTALYWTAIYFKDDNKGE